MRKLRMLKNKTGRRSAALAGLAASIAAALTVAGSTSAQRQDTMIPAAQQAVSIRFQAVGGTHVEGRATLTAVGGGTAVAFDVTGLPSTAPAAARLHAGTCVDVDGLSASFALLTTLIADPTGRARAASRVRYPGRDDVRMSTLTDGEHAIVIAVEGTVVGCGTIPRVSGPTIDPASIIVGKAIGGVRIGMTEPQVVRANGRPRRASAVTFAGGRLGRIGRYTRHGAPFIVMYSRGRVVWVETSSPYYKTTPGVGVGSPIGAAARLPGFRRDLCEGGYSRRVNGTLTSFIPSRRLISRVRIVKVEFFNC